MNSWSFYLRHLRAKLTGVQHLANLEALKILVGCRDTKENGVIALPHLIN